MRFCKSVFRFSISYDFPTHLHEISGKNTSIQAKPQKQSWVFISSESKDGHKPHTPGIKRVWHDDVCSVKNDSLQCDCAIERQFSYATSLYVTNHRGQVKLAVSA